jgi:HK97 family phage portal protein
MGRLARAVAERKASDPLAIWAEMLRAGAGTKAGQTVNLDTALKCGVALACLRVISQGVAQVPWKLFREGVATPSGLVPRVPARELPLYDVISTQPNDWQTSFEFRETMVMHAAFTHGAFAYKVRGLGGRVAELILLQPSTVQKIQREDWSIHYKVTGKSGAIQDFTADDVWHLPGMSWDGVEGLRVMSLAREALGLSIAMEESHAKLHANGVRPSGIYSVEGNLNTKQHDELKAWIQKEHVGAETGGVMVLDRAAKFVSNLMTGVDAQHLESRRFQIEEICRFFGVMPIMVGYSDKAATYASSEQMFLAHVVHTLSPWYRRIEMSANVNLLTRKERAAGLYTKFMAAGLLRGDMKTTSDYLSRMVEKGIMTRNEARELLELNPLEGLDQPLTPVNMQIGLSAVPANQPADA